MLTSRPFSAVLGLGLAATVAQAQVTPTAPAPAAPPAPAREYPRSSLGGTLGWGAPYGWSIDFSRQLTRQLDVTVGAGFTITGGKIGLGTRYYFTPERKVSGFVGGNLVYSGGINRLEISSASDGHYGVGVGWAPTEAVIKIKSANLLHLRGGLRWQPLYRFGMVGALGYGVVLGADPVEYIEGPAFESTRRKVNLISPGGLEVSIGVAFGVSDRD